ncbi:MAG: DUF4838 domain-containing protein [Kiritimatiellae bacterium]|nr:DUF4838 domain-containing protein [Kiritimatiellia bacterium]
MCTNGIALRSAVCAALLLSVAGNAAAGGRLAIVDGMSSAEVVLSSRAEESSRLAAVELTNYVYRATGRLLPVRFGGGGAGAKVVIGTLDTLDRVPSGVRERLCAMRQPEASWTGVAEGCLWFVGREEVAELYAVYHFLESELGVRWFQAPTPEDCGEYVPKAERVVLAPFSRFREPAFAVRRLDHCGAAARPVPEKGMATAVRNGFQVLPPYGGAVEFGKRGDFFAARVPRRNQPLGGGHLTFVNPMPGDKTFDEHPEFFALVDGKREKGGHHMSQYCMSNPEVRRRTAEYILGRLEKFGGRGQFLFGQVDTPHGYCHCENCMALDGPNERANGGKSRTTRFVKTVNDIAARVWEKAPSADLRMWAYLDYRELPDGVAPNPRLKLYFCPHGRCYGHALDDASCLRNAGMFALLKGWQRLLKDVYVYEYLNCTPHLYSCSEAREAHDIRLYRDLGLIGWKNEAAFSGAKFIKSSQAKKDQFPSNWQWLYLSGKLLWDPGLDEGAVLDDVESKYYGVAYPAMKEYQALRRKLWNEHPNHLGYPTGDQRRAALLDRAGAKERLLGLLDDAERLAKDDAVALFRVRRDRRWLNDYWIKENDAVRARRSLTLNVPKRRGEIVIDGDGGEAAWGGAVVTDEFRQMGRGRDGAHIPSALATTAAMLYDDDSLYFLVDAKEPSPARMKAEIGPNANVWDDDGVEIFLFPPSIENRCYHVAVNSKGAVWGANHPGGRVSNAFGAEAAVKVLDDRYVLEMRIPAKNVAPIAKGASWRVLVGRNRTVGDEHTPGAKPGGAAHFSLDGVGYHDSLSYRPFEFGGAYLRNGAFTEPGEKGLPKSWGFPVGCAGVEKTPEGVVVRLLAGQRMQQTMWHGELRQAPKPRRLRFSVRAAGAGTLSVVFFRYNDTTDPKAPHGYRRRQIQPSGSGGKFALSAEAKTFEGEYEVSGDEWCSIGLIAAGGEALVHSVSVDPASP